MICPFLKDVLQDSSGEACVEIQLNSAPTQELLFTNNKLIVYLDSRPNISQLQFFGLMTFFGAHCNTLVMKESWGSANRCLEHANTHCKMHTLVFSNTEFKAQYNNVNNQHVTRLYMMDNTFLKGSLFAVTRSFKNLDVCHMDRCQFVQEDHINAYIDLNLSRTDVKKLYVNVVFDGISFSQEAVCSIFFFIKTDYKEL